MYTDATPTITTAAEVLDGLEGVRDQQRVIDRGLVVLAVEWAKHHPSRNSTLPAFVPDRSPYDFQGEFDELALRGCQSFDDDAVTEFGIAAGLTTRTARRLIRESIMLVHFLPRVWARVLAGGLDVWRARNLAGDCFGLTPAAIEFVDAQMSASTARLTPSARESLIARARAQYMPEEEQSLEDEAKAARCVSIHAHEPLHGVVPVDAVLDLPDALALEAALSAGAQALADAGSDAPLEVRRSWALGDLARSASGHGTLLPTSNPGLCSCGGVAPGAWVPAETSPGQRPHWNGKGASPPGVKLFIHLDHTAIDPPSTGSPPNEFAPFRTDTTARVGRVEGPALAGTHVCTPETIREWFTRPTLAGAHLPDVSIRPTLDRSEEINSGSYQVTERSKDHVALSHAGCIFPFCTRPAHVCDADHTIPWKSDGQGGATCTCNLAPLCRTHHRIKTHGDNAPTENGEHNVWSYTHLGGREYFWKGPRNWAFIRTRDGTFEAAADPTGAAPAHPGAPVAQDAHRATFGDDGDRAATEDLVGRLLHRSAFTRRSGALEMFPLWATPNGSKPPTLHPEPDYCDPPEQWNEDGEYAGPNMFLLIPTAMPTAG